ncbi:MAG TPA: hypothetical protein VNB58_06465 [Gaiellaceae bacterium]|nr:hypothetical protein [Gaiellaceae bacterium]
MSPARHACARRRVLSVEPRERPRDTRSGRFFLHVEIGKATSGCVSLRRPALVHLLRWFDPDALPQIAIGTTGSLRQARRS